MVVCSVAWMKNGWCGGREERRVSNTGNTYAKIQNCDQTGRAPRAESLVGEQSTTWSPYGTEAEEVGSRRESGKWWALKSYRQSFEAGTGCSEVRKTLVTSTNLPIVFGTSMLQLMVTEFKRKLNTLITTFMLWIIHCNWNCCCFSPYNSSFSPLLRMVSDIQVTSPAFLNVYHVWDHKEEQARTTKYRRRHGWINRKFKVVKNLKNNKYTGKVNNTHYVISVPTLCWGNQC